MTARGAKAGNGGPASSPEKQGGAPAPAPRLSLGQDTPEMRWARCTGGAETAADAAPCLRFRPLSSRRLLACLPCEAHVDAH